MVCATEPNYERIYLSGRSGEAALLDLGPEKCLTPPRYHLDEKGGSHALGLGTRARQEVGIVKR